MFKQGDKAVCTLDDRKVMIQFGPFLCSAGEEAYLVLEEGSSYSLTIWAQDLEPAPRFKVGQKVKINYLSKCDPFELVAGPFVGPCGGAFWVMKDGEGAHETAWDEYLTEAE